MLFKGGPDATGGSAISGSVRYSPDGRFIALGLNGATDTYARIHVMNADGTGLRRLDNEPGTFVDNDLVWSPDGSRIAFNRWREESTDNWSILPIGIVSVNGGPVTSLGPTPVPEGALFDWSPDGTAIVSVHGPLSGFPSLTTTARPLEIDANRGTSHELPWQVNSVTSYQRLAP
jgi:Tol biopolymer transport system component